MAEAAGLAVGVLALIGAFKDAIDFFNNFKASRELGRDYELLVTRLDIERTILLQWAEHVNLLRPDRDPRLNNPDTMKAIDGLIAKLNQIMPTGGSTRSLTDEDIAALRSLRELHNVLEVSTGRSKIMSETTAKYIERMCQDRILEALWFRTIDDRKESISPAHRNTLHWALDPGKTQFQWNNLARWLQHDSGIYWVSGKAGSGKSTLMKYLFTHPETHSLLSQWAEGRTFSLIHFFFWNIGTQEQKSQKGLSRSLLYQILSKHPSLISAVLPNMWKQLRHNERDVDLPSIAETRAAFRVIASSSSNIGKFCFFIDGLDEFVGNHLDGIAFLQDLALNKHIKIIASSRPIPDCVASFDGLPTLQLHDLNRPDIKSYVDDVIGGHKYMQRLKRESLKEALQIIDDIVAMSSGVFLWVILACRSLISGFSDFDRISELRRRVDELPPELEEMFQHMLIRVSSRHLKQGARILRICYMAHQARRSDKVGEMSALGLALLDGDIITETKIQKLTKKQAHQNYEDLDGRLRSRCGGLLELEIKNRSVGHIQYKSYDALTHGKIVFMHRTVFEFLSDAKTWELKCLQPPAGFEVSVDLSLIGLYSAMFGFKSKNMQASNYFRDGIWWGVQSDRNHPHGPSNIFWAIQPFIDTPWLQRNVDMFRRLAEINEHRLSSGASHATLTLAVEAGAANYAKNHPDFSSLVQPKLHQCGCPPLIYHAVALPVTNGTLDTRGSGKDRVGCLSESMASLLLASGSDPNHSIAASSFSIQGCNKSYNPSQSGKWLISKNCKTSSADFNPWVAWLGSPTKGRRLEPEDRIEQGNIAMLFLNAGAIVPGPFRYWIQNDFSSSSDPSVQAKGKELLDLWNECEKRQKDTATDTRGGNVNQALSGLGQLQSTDDGVGLPASPSERKRSAEIDTAGGAKRICPVERCNPRVS
ncbi:hypothetical protein K469DRAFT_621887 [Zopfia rhizophila CBS 207.26]|uniref:NACHT domain-containing protein n=1 Tax=Zopfia rhizophila CBS 207.26 TaxID=1314779 RepID=A0A6A6EL94_9PEZI|nr:hypothetical protein K469DRAFT_621887 [Zopfia rhizophila CBS 207.26]